MLDRIIEWPDDAPPELVRRYGPRFSTRGRCRRCGCTERRGCPGSRIWGCAWVNDRRTLCSRCVSRPGRRRYRRPRLGYDTALRFRAWYAERREGGG